MTQDQLITLADDLFTRLVEGVDGPQDAAEVLLNIHVCLWKNQEGTCTTEEMLDIYKNTFLAIMGEQTKARLQ
jgi:hypothetical protein